MVYQWPLSEYLFWTGHMYTMGRSLFYIIYFRCCYITVNSETTALQNGACTYRCISNHHSLPGRHAGAGAGRATGARAQGGPTTHRAEYHTHCMLAYHNITGKLSFYHIMLKLDEKNTTRHSFYEHSAAEYLTLTIHNWISMWTKKSKICFISINRLLLKKRLCFYLCDPFWPLKRSGGPLGS